MPRIACVGIVFALWFAVGLSAEQHESPIRASLEQEARRLASTLVVASRSLEGSDGRVVVSSGRVELSEGTQGEVALTVAQAASSGGGVPARPRVSADRLLGGQGVTGSFEALQPLLGSGYEVVVTDDAGRVRRGRVASLSRDQLVMASPVAAGSWEALLPLYWPLDLGVVLKRQVFRSRERVFAEGSVRRIDIVDSTRNGTAIGAAVGAGLVAGVYQWERGQPDSSLKGLATVVVVLLGFPTSLRLGHVLDRAINEPIYERQPRKPQVTVSPWLGRNVKGVVAQARF